MTDYKFDVDDIGEDADTDEESVVDTSSATDGFNITTLLLLPLSIFAAYAFVEKAATISALSSLFGGASGLATAVGTAAWLTGALLVASIALAAVLSAVLLLTGLVQRSSAKFGLGLLGALYFAAGYAGTLYVFSEVHVLVGFMLTTTALTWGGLLVIGALVIVAGIIIA